MNRIIKFLSIAAFSLLVLGLPAIASAQYNGGYGYPNGGYGYPNGGYGNGGYGNTGSYGGDPRSAARELKDLTRRFEKDLDRSPIYSKNNDRGGWYGGGYGGYGNNGDSSYVRKLADQFADAASDLNGRMGNGRNSNDGYNEANRVFSLAQQLDSSLRQRGLDNYLQTDWNRIQYDLQVISSYYGNGRYNTGRGGRNNGGYNTGGWGNRPSWWPF